jgi:hypothetical protein
MQLLPLLVAGGVAGMAVLLVVRLLEVPIERQVAAFGNLLGGYRREGWPIGVQEEDRDRPWGRSRPSTIAADDPGAAEPAPTAAVRPVTRLRA